MNDNFKKKKKKWKSTRVLSSAEWLRIPQNSIFTLTTLHRPICYDSFSPCRVWRMNLHSRHTQTHTHTLRHHQTAKYKQYAAIYSICMICILPYTHPSTSTYIFFFNKKIRSKFCLLYADHTLVEKCFVQRSELRAKKKKKKREKRKENDVVEWKNRRMDIV